MQTFSREDVIKRYREGMTNTIKSGEVTAQEANEAFKLIISDQWLSKVASMPMEMQDHVELFCGFRFFSEKAGLSEYEIPFSLKEYDVPGTRLVVALSTYREDCEDYLCPEGYMYDREDTWSYTIELYPK